MKTQDNIYVGGAWVRSGGTEAIAVVNRRKAPLQELAAFLLQREY